MSVDGVTPDAFQPLPDYQKTLRVWTQFGAPGMRWPKTILLPDNRFGGLGFIWLLGGLPAALVLLVRKIVFRRPRARLFALVLAVTTLAFVTVPIHWFARYVIWVHGLGLSCLAVLASGARGRSEVSGSRMGSRPFGQAGEVPCGRGRSLLARTWFAVCVFVLLLEGAVVFLFTVFWTIAPNVDLEHLYHEGRLAEVLRRGDWLAEGYPMPELDDPALGRVLRSNATVAVGRLGGKYRLIRGRLSLPIGRRKIVPLLEPINEAKIRRLHAEQVQYVIWDGTRPLPDLLAEEALHIDRPPGYQVLTMKPR
jgi:hypothetical protein